MYRSSFFHFPDLPDLSWGLQLVIVFCQQTIGAKIIYIYFCHTPEINLIESKVRNFFVWMTQWTGTLSAVWVNEPKQETTASDPISSSYTRGGFSINKEAGEGGRGANHYIRSNQHQLHKGRIQHQQGGRGGGGGQTTTSDPISISYSRLNQLQFHKERERVGRQTPTSDAISMGSTGEGRGGKPLHQFQSTSPPQGKRLVC